MRTIVLPVLLGLALGLAAPAWAQEPDNVEDPTPTRMIFGPNARALKPGEGIAGAYAFALPFFQIGVTDRFSVGAGAPFFFLTDGEHTFWLTPKYQFYRHASTSAAAGLIHIGGLGGLNLGAAYVAETTGSPDSSITLGAAYAYANYEPSSHGRGHAGTAVFLIGGERRIGRRVKIVTENYVFADGVMVSGAFRLMGKHFAADLGLMSPLLTGVGGLYPAPIVNLVWKF